ncbi:hypothetical protein BU25DRAFT_425617 [Macroventuria anomochaeta]|uniref:Uncharacterized protein n=1 Tax=Macroventuria anomochaeta TaxID=301207 RepID=A0ACB6RKJ0_9PLEO|nr:uncharacterized protein BU25DRAFT_425617 [Macroventuria anomochaeta]KAF2622440.1 hypothetical protein BU25DRAFT_425617 [Macroventuria anomochaeta]
MPQLSFMSWLIGAQRRVIRSNSLPSRSEWLETLIHDAPYLNSSNPNLSDECAICFRVFTRGLNRSRIRLSCGHRHFCRACLRKWSLRGKTTCPYCREELWYPHPPFESSDRPTTRGLNAVAAMASSPSDLQDWTGLTSHAPTTPSASRRRFNSQASMPWLTARRVPIRQIPIPAWAVREDLDATEPQASVVVLVNHFNRVAAGATQTPTDGTSRDPATRSRTQMRHPFSDPLRD